VRMIEVPERTSPSLSLSLSLSRVRRTREYSRGLIARVRSRFLDHAEELFATLRKMPARIARSEFFNHVTKFDSPPRGSGSRRSPTSNWVILFSYSVTPVLPMPRE